MRAVTCRAGVLEVVEVPTPEPGPGQVLVRVTRSGICGSDLHARRHGDAVAAVTAEVGYDDFMRSDESVIMGHEFTGEVAAYGPRCRRRWPIGTPVVTLPILREDGAPHLIGLSRKAPGGYAEYVLVTEDMTMPVPDGLDPDLAALTEPLAVARHAVRRSDVRGSDVAVVIGCGPIGLAVVLMLKGLGVRTVVASDYSETRRALAARCGADEVVDPAVRSPWDAYTPPSGEVRRAPEMLAGGLDAMHALQRIPRFPWWSAIRAAERLGLGPRGPVVFECVGVPGVIEDIITAAPFRSRVVVVGVCMQDDVIRPSMAVNKETDLRFVFAYDPVEFRDALHAVARGRVDPRPLLTGTVGLDGVEAAFDDLTAGTGHAKILVDPTAS